MIFKLIWSMCLWSCYLQLSGNCEKGPHHFLAFTDVLGRQTRCGYVEERRRRFSGHGASQHRFTISCRIEISEWRNISGKSFFHALPGGPKSRRPRAGVRSPVKSSGRNMGRITISCSACLANCEGIAGQHDDFNLVIFVDITDNPAISLKETPAPPSMISSRMSDASFESTPLIGPVIPDLAALEGAVCWTQR